MRFTTLALGPILAATALSAHAEYITINYTGAVDRVVAATSGPAGPADIVVGTPVTLTATFDTAKFKAFSPNLTYGPTGAAIYLQTGGYTIFDDKLASYTITVGSHAFYSSTDDGDGFVNPTNGAGPFPFVSYAGDQLLGIEADAFGDGGLELNSVPGSFLLGERRHEGYGFFPVDGDYIFTFDTELHSAIVSEREAGLYAAAVPEPSSWALLLAGIGGVAYARRRPAVRTIA